jgi:hypothetical protein
MMNFATPTPVLQLLQNEIVKNACNQEWGRLAASANEWVHEAMLQALGYNAQIVHGEPYDILANESIRIQSKLRQVHGASPWSKAVYLETTRRVCQKNYNADLTGHVAYHCDEFDFLLVSLVHEQETRDQPNTWFFSLIPQHALINPRNPQCLVTSVSPEILQRYAVSNDPLNLNQRGT